VKELAATFLLVAASAAVGYLLGYLNHYVYA
jgi:hypothetical protein